jgi:hypothetical protein
MEGQEFLLCEGMRSICEKEAQLEIENLTSIDNIRPFASLTEYTDTFYITHDDLKSQKMYFCSLFSGTRHKTLIFSNGAHLLPPGHLRNQCSKDILFDDLFCVAVETIISDVGTTSHEIDLFIFRGQTAKLQLLTEGEVKGLGYYSSIHVHDSVYIPIFNHTAITIGNLDEFKCEVKMDKNTFTRVESIDWKDDRGLLYLYQCLNYKAS